MSNLKEIRLAKGFSQSQLAKNANVNVNMIQKYEQGVKDINKASAITIYKLSKVLKTSMENLIELSKVDE